MIWIVESEGFEPSSRQGEHNAFYTLSCSEIFERVQVNNYLKTHLSYLAYLACATLATAVLRDDASSTSSAEQRTCETHAI